MCEVWSVLCSLMCVFFVVWMCACLFVFCDCFSLSVYCPGIVRLFGVVVGVWGPVDVLCWHQMVSILSIVLVLFAVGIGCGVGISIR